jgi:hypothetical protein|tara:strand:+ start:772 stop:1341 length:570 start_codon:yes stop_codon:yes gene_type:complete
MNFYTGLEKEVSAEIREWSLNTLEQPNPAYNNFPACPFAAKAWTDDKVGIVFKYDASFQPLYSIISAYDDRFELIILVDLDYEVAEEKFHQRLEGLNEAIADGIFIDKDIYLMGFHPETEANDLLDDSEFETTIDTLYGMVFIQRLSLLCKASEKLMSKGYYKRDHGNYDVKAILAKRNELYRRFKSGR